MEEEFGLTAFVGADRKQTIECVLKRLYSDFIVQEIDADMKVAALPSFDQQDTATISNLVSTRKNIDQSITRPSSVTETFVSECDNVFNRVANQANLPTSDLDKAARTAVHVFVRERYADELESETGKDGAIEAKRRKPGKRKRWGRDMPPHTHFTMAKENKETSYAIGVIAKMSGCNPSLFKTCGLKDRRAVTAQRVSAYQVDMDKLLLLNTRLRDLVLYDFSYEKQAVKTGSHWGNRFSIVLRDIALDVEPILQSRLEEWAEKGFVNYYGTQRFGSCDTRTADIGRLILQREWRKSVMGILGGAARNGHDTVQRAVEEYCRTEDAGAALKLLQGGPAYASIEGQLLRTLSRGKTWQDAVIQLPVNIRSLYVHAYQSLLWNVTASKRLTSFSTKVIEGDLNGEGERMDEKQRESSTPFDVALPLPSSACEGKEGWVFDEYKVLLDKDGLTWDSFRTLERHFSLGDSSKLTMRPLLGRPVNVEWKFVRCTAKDEQLQDSLKAKAAVSLEEAEKRTEGDRALWMRFDLNGGVYATVALREITACDMGKRYQKQLNCGADDENTGETGEEENNGEGREDEENAVKGGEEDEPSVKVPRIE